jgi:hypothetical protein
MRWIFLRFQGAILALVAGMSRTRPMTVLDGLLERFSRKASWGWVSILRVWRAGLGDTDAYASGYSSD